MEYKVVVTRRRNSHLSHAEQGEERENHKYVARVETKNPKNKYRYFYSMADYNAYLKSDEAKKDKVVSAQLTNGANTKTAKNVSQTIPKANKKSKFSAKIESLVSGAKNLVNNATFKISELPNSVKETGKKTVEKITTSVAKKKEQAVEAMNKKVDQTLEKVNKNATKAANDAVKKVKEVATKLYDDPDNMYDIKATNYNKKIKQIEQSEEWQAIVKSGDPEYVKKNADGTTNYLIDDYVMKKKKPVLDIIDDLANGREISLNKIDKKALVAGLKQQVIGKITTGAMVVGIAAKAIMEMGKVSQGSYNDEIKELYNKIDAGKTAVDDIVDTYNSINPEDVERLSNAIKKSADTLTDTSKASEEFNSGDVISAVKVILESDTIPDEVRANEHFQNVEKTLTNLSDKEIAMINVLVNTARNADNQSTSDTIQDILDSGVIPEEVRSNEQFQKVESTISNLSDEEIEMLKALLGGGSR